MLDAICTIPGLVFLKHLKVLEERHLVHQVALAAEKVGKVIEDYANAEDRSAKAFRASADKSRTDALEKVTGAIMTDLDKRKNRVDIKGRRLVLSILENRSKLPSDFKLQILRKVVRVDPLSAETAKLATAAYEERICRYWARKTLKVVKTTISVMGRTGSKYEFEGHEFSKKQLDYLKDHFGITVENISQKWGVKLEERQETIPYPIGNW